MAENNNVVTQKWDKEVEAFRYAVETRKLEIELYWKRAGYFWALIAVAFAGYHHYNAARFQFLVSCLGLLFSLGWYLVNRGSKYWQDNWEKRVDELENEVVGSLFKTRVVPDYSCRKLFCDPFGAYPFSASKVNQALSLFVFVLWVGLWIWSFPVRPAWASCSCTDLVAGIVPAALTLGFVGLLVCCCRTDRKKEPAEEVTLETRKVTFKGEDGAT
jgi:hypothetical protein